MFGTTPAAAVAAEGGCESVLNATVSFDLVPNILCWLYATGMRLLVDWLSLMADSSQDRVSRLSHTGGGCPGPPGRPRGRLGSFVIRLQSGEEKASWVGRLVLPVRSPCFLSSLLLRVEFRVSHHPAGLTDPSYPPSQQQNGWFPRFLFVSFRSLFWIGLSLVGSNDDRLDSC